MKLNEIFDEDQGAHNETNYIQKGFDGEFYITKKNFLSLLYRSTLPYKQTLYIRTALDSKKDDYQIYARMIHDIVNDAGWSGPQGIEMAKEILDITGLWNLGYHEFK